MSQEIVLRPLRGRSPQGLLAALGALDVATRALPHAAPTLRWTTSLEPFAVLSGPDGMDHLVSLCVDDLERWESSPVFAWGPDGVPLFDLKPEVRSVLPTWIGVASQTSDRADSDLLAALVADGALAGNQGKPTDKAKPTHLDFTAGQQRFLEMARELRAGVREEHLRAALAGPWTYESTLPGFGWRERAEHAYRAIAPADDKTPLVVPGAEWLGLLGLRYLPVATRRGQLRTTGCSGSWSVGTFTWPLWDRRITSAVVGSLLGRGDLPRRSIPERRAIGITLLLRAPMTRTSQGYGTLGAASVVAGGDLG